MLTRSQSSYSSPIRSRRRSAAPGWATVAGLFLLAVPVLVFGWVWHRYAINIPKWDDHALRAFLFNSDQETTVSGKLYQLFRQHNEHRIVYDRVVTLLDYWLFGKLNYVHLMAVGNLSLAGLLAVFAAVLRRSRVTHWMLYAVPVALLLFNLSQWENMFWGMAALQNFSVVLWVLAAFYFLTFTSRWGLAFTTGVLATLTSGNGLMVWPIGLVLILLRTAEAATGTKRTAFRPALSWAIGALVVIGLYFVRFEKPGGAHAVRRGLTDLLKGWFAVVGAAAEALPVGSPLRNSMLLGGLMAFVTLSIVGVGLFINQRSIRRVLGQFRRNSRAGNRAVLPPIALFFWGSAGFLLGTAAVVAYARTGFGAELLITSRYKIYSLTLLALLYLYAVATLPGRAGSWVGVAGGLGSLVFAGLSYVAFLDETIWWRHWLTTNQFNWYFTTSTPVAVRDPVTSRYSERATGFYDAVLPAIYGPAKPAKLTVRLTKTSAGFAVSEQTIEPQGLLDEGAYLLARSARRTYLFPTWQNRQSLIQARLLPGRLFANGFQADLATTELVAGTYQLYVFVVPAHPASPYLLDTQQTITSAGQPVETTEKNW